MRRIHSRHFQICGIDKYWQILFAKVVSRHYSSIYARTPENVDEYSVFAYSRPFSNCMMRSKIKHAARWPKLSFSLTNTQILLTGIFRYLELKSYIEFWIGCLPSLWIKDRVSRVIGGGVVKNDEKTKLLDSFFCGCTRMWAHIVTLREKSGVHFGRE